jgi:hypothetical protein
MRMPGLQVDRLVSRLVAFVAFVTFVAFVAFVVLEHPLGRARYNSPSESWQQVYPEKGMARAERGRLNAFVRADIGT